MRKVYILYLSIFVSFSLGAQIENVFDIAPGDANAGISNIFTANGLLFFEADDGTNGDELWVSDGTAEGTFMIAINNDTLDSTPNGDPSNFIMYNGLIYFNGNNGDNSGASKELWVTDATQEGTLLVADIDTAFKSNGRAEGSNPQEFFVFNDNLYFQARIAANNKNELWTLSGDSVSQVTNISPNGSATVSFPYIDIENNRVFLRAKNDTSGFELFVFTGDSTYLVKDINTRTNGYNARATSRAIYNGRFYFEADDDVNGDELWVSDGTDTGTIMVADINAGDENGDPDYLTVYGDYLYFKAEIDANDNEALWRTDGTAEGTEQVFLPGVVEDSEVSDLFVFNDVLYFVANDSVSGSELWLHWGDTTYLVKDINPEGDSDPEGFVVIDDRIYFAADSDDDGDPELWSTNGSEENTVQVATLFDTTANPLDVDDLIVMDGQLFFVGADTTDMLGEELYVLTPTAPSSNEDIVSNAPDFKVYPNPSNTGIFQLEVEGLDIQSYQIFDLQGRQVQQGRLDNNTLRLDQLSGTYFGLFKTEERFLVKKLIIAR